MRWAAIQQLDGAPSYRQMDTWTTAGLLKTENASNPGTGRGREWSASQVAEAFRIKGLSSLGLPLEEIRRVIEAPKDARGTRTVELRPGIWLTIK